MPGFIKQLITASRSSQKKNIHRVIECSIIEITYSCEFEEIVAGTSPGEWQIEQFRLGDFTIDTNEVYVDLSFTACRSEVDKETHPLSNPLLSDLMTGAATAIIDEDEDGNVMVRFEAITGNHGYGPSVSSGKDLVPGSADWYSFWQDPCRWSLSRNGVLWTYNDDHILSVKKQSPGEFTYKILTPADEPIYEPRPFSSKETAILAVLERLVRILLPKT